MFQTLKKKKKEINLIFLFKILPSPVFPILVNCSTGLPLTQVGNAGVFLTSPFFSLIHLC